MAEARELAAHRLRVWPLRRRLGQVAVVLRRVQLQVPGKLRIAARTTAKCRQRAWNRRCVLAGVAL
eukprot:4737279-Alexandrium_andersonii.AAC.1